MSSISPNMQQKHLNVDPMECKNGIWPETPQKVGVATCVCTNSPKWRSNPTVVCRPDFHLGPVNMFGSQSPNWNGLKFVSTKHGSRHSQWDHSEGNETQEPQFRTKPNDLKQDGETGAPRKQLGSTSLRGAEFLKKVKPNKGGDDFF